MVHHQLKLTVVSNHNERLQNVVTSVKSNNEEKFSI